jgi:hypothetical protein
MSKQLVGMLICIFVSERFSLSGGGLMSSSSGINLSLSGGDTIKYSISEIRSSSTGVGLMGMIGNKGAVFVLLSKYYYYCF